LELLAARCAPRDSASKKGRKMANVRFAETIRVLLASAALLALLGSANQVIAQAPTGDDFTCFQNDELAKHALQPGTRVFFKTRVEIVQRTERTVKAHIMADAGTIKGSVSDGTMAFDKKNIVLDPGVPISFSIGQQICAVPAGAAIPNFLKPLPYYLAP
jgi:hypothetical protein